jgi:hypothetical protein
MADDAEVEETEEQETEETETQEVEETEVENADKPDAVKKLIETERKRAKSYAAKVKELERQLKEREEKVKPLEEQIKSATDRVAEAELRATRLEIAAAAKLPLELATRLKGETEGELREDAKALLALVGSQTKAPGPGADGGYKQDPPEKKNPAKEHNDLLSAILTGQVQKGAPLFSGLQQAPDDDE